LLAIFLKKLYIIYAVVDINLLGVEKMNKRDVKKVQKQMLSNLSDFHAVRKPTHQELLNEFLVNGGKVKKRKRVLGTPRKPAQTAYCRKAGKLELRNRRQTALEKE